MKDWVSVVERKLMPRLERLGQKAHRLYPRARVETWSFPIGQATVFQGHSFGLQCSLPAGELELVVELGDVPGRTCFTCCCVRWVEPTHSLVDFFPHKVRFHGRGSGCTQYRPWHLRKGLPQVLAALEREIESGTPPAGEPAEGRSEDLKEVSSADLDVYQAVLDRLGRPPLFDRKLHGMRPDPARRLQFLNRWPDWPAALPEDARCLPGGLPQILSWRQFYREHPGAPGLLALWRVAYSEAAAYVVACNQIGFVPKSPVEPKPGLSAEFKLMLRLQRCGSGWAVVDELDVSSPPPQEFRLAVQAQSLQSKLDELGAPSITIGQFSWDGFQARVQGNRLVTVATPSWLHRKLHPELEHSSSSFRVLTPGWLRLDEPLVLVRELEAGLIWGGVRQWFEVHPK